MKDAINQSVLFTVQTTSAASTDYMSFHTTLLPIEDTTPKDDEISLQVASKVQSIDNLNWAWQHFNE